MERFPRSARDRENHRATVDLWFANALSSLVSGTRNQKTAEATVAIAANIRKLALYPAFFATNPANKLLSISAPAGVWAMTAAIDEAAAAMPISAGFQFCEDFR